MKKVILLLIPVLLFTLAACGSDGNSATQDPTAEPSAVITAPVHTFGTEATTPTNKTFSFTFAGVQLVPGENFNASQLPAASSISQVPSCAFEGTDNAYNYGTFELTAYTDGSNEVIYSIYLLDPNTATDEGLYLGDDLMQATMLYGDEFERNGTQLIYTRGTTQLILILQDDVVTSIEYRMAQ